MCMHLNAFHINMCLCVCVYTFDSMHVRMYRRSQYCRDSLLGIERDCPLAGSSPDMSVY